MAEEIKVVENDPTITIENPTFDQKYKVEEFAKAMNKSIEEAIDTIRKYTGEYGKIRAKDEGSAIEPKDSKGGPISLTDIYAVGKGQLIHEAITRDDVKELLRDAYNQKFLQGYDETEYLWGQVYDTMDIDTKNVDFPFIKGVWVATVGEGTEIPEVSFVSGKSTVTPAKYALIVNITNEMIEDNEVGLVGWVARRIGRRYREKEDALAFAVFEAIGNASFITGALVGEDPAVSGYLTKPELLKNIIEADRALEIRTETVGAGGAQKAPVHANILILPSGLKYIAKEVFNATFTYDASVGGFSNVFGQAFPGLNYIITPYLTHDDATNTKGYLLKAKDNAIMVRRTGLTLDSDEDFVLDCTKTRAKMRLAFAVGEMDKIAAFLAYE